MIGTKCPGQDMRYWTAEDIHEEKCPQCGEMIEFFKTDIRLRCPNCKTRVANPSFNMGCAQWCAYAEQCLGPAARGLKTKSLRTVMEEELVRLTRELPEEKDKIKNIIIKAETICNERKVDMLSVITAIVLISFKKLNLINDLDSYIENLQTEHQLPRQALINAKQVIDEINNNDLKSDMAKLIHELL